MRIGSSIFIIALGAVLTFAVEVDSTNNFNINTAGVILMIVGAVGLLASLVMSSSSSRRTTVTQDGAGRQTVTRDTVTRDTPAA